MHQTLEYINRGQYGYIVYKDEQEEIKLFYEFSSGNCIAIIYIPSNGEWTKKTDLPIEERESILLFIAKQVIKDKAPGCYYEITDSRIRILTKPKQSET